MAGHLAWLAVLFVVVVVVVVLSFFFNLIKSRWYTILHPNLLGHNIN